MHQETTTIYSRPNGGCNCFTMNPLRTTICHRFQESLGIGLGVRGSLVRIQSSRPIFSVWKASGIRPKAQGLFQERVLGLESTASSPVSSSSFVARDSVLPTSNALKRRIQFSVGISARSTTNTGTDPRLASSLRPSCSCTAVKTEGRLGSGRPGPGTPGSCSDENARVMS